jgi:hypothetical protein
MLRHVLGDSVFFNSFRAYAQDPRFRFGVATTEDFRQVCESVSGKELGYFIDEWIYGEKYPAYTYSWSAVPDTNGGFLVNIKLVQSTGTANPTFFAMPIDCKLKAGDWDTTVVLFNNSQRQLFIVHASRPPDTVELDPDNWILHDAHVTSGDKPFLVVDTRPTFFGTNDSLLRVDTTFLVRNIGFAPDSLSTSIAVDPGNAPPESAIAVFPSTFSLAAGDSQKVTFSIRPRLIPPGYYEVSVVIHSRFGQQLTFSKLMGFDKPAVGDVADLSGLPREFALSQNYPNPFNPSTTIKYELPQSSVVKLSVFDMLGREVSVLVDERRDAGVHEVKFDASGLASGVYLYRLQAGDFVQARKLVVVK